MPIVIACPGCQTKFRAPESFAGRSAQCPKCKGHIQIPATTPPASSAGGAAPKQKAAAPPAASSRASAVKKSEGSTTARRPPAEALSAIAKSPAPEKKPLGPAKYDDLDVVSGASNRWALSGPARKSRLLIKRRWGLSQLAYRDYDILDYETQEPVGVANESPSLWVLLLGGLSVGRIRIRALLPTTLEIREREDGPLLFRLVRQPKPLGFFIQVSIYDGDGKSLGYFQSKLFSFFGGFHIFGSQNEEIGEAKFQWTFPPSLSIIDHEKGSLGSCYRDGFRDLYEGTKKAVWNFNFGPLKLDFKYSDAIAKDPRSKLLFLASILAMDYTGLGNAFGRGRNR